MNISSLLALLPIALPLLVTLLAGLLRQDRLPDWANEAISLALILVASVLNAVFDHRLVSNPILDFIVLCGYMAALIQSPLLQPLQQYLQSNILVFLKAASELPPPPDPAVTQPRLKVVPPASQAQPPKQVSRGG